MATTKRKKNLMAKKRGGAHVGQGGITGLEDVAFSSDVDNIFLDGSVTNPYPGAQYRVTIRINPSGVPIYSDAGAPPWTAASVGDMPASDATGEARLQALTPTGELLAESGWLPFNV